MLYNLDGIYAKFLESSKSQKKNVEMAKKSLEKLEEKSYLPDAQENIKNTLNSILWGIKHGERSWLALRDMYEEVIDIYGLVFPEIAENAISDRICGEMMAMDIEVEYTSDNWVHIKLPHFITTFGNIKSSNRVWEPLDKSLKNLNAKREICYDKHVIVFIQNVSKYSRLPIKDNDNVAVRGVVNIISRNFLPDDCAEYVDVHICSKFSEENYVDVYLLPYKDINLFYDKIKRSIDTKTSITAP